MRLGILVRFVLVTLMAVSISANAAFATPVLRLYTFARNEGALFESTDGGAHWNAGRGNWLSCRGRQKRGISPRTGKQEASIV